ncbi:hypothetical protein OOT55_11140 [Marinimicrobium sp. C6131]|uniref:hypothetical protein n=1 Tax=Marinimicrobium sp. C6131 TaxID=3022676 RepID=UPI00223CC41C|nr:hypothetical protein [Marinimicrobium sp. C6131]UZJ43204.1 hypothetical protein OOT55_11140 [Marinimicrobium sp. C6131]
MLLDKNSVTANKAVKFAHENVNGKGNTVKKLHIAISTDKITETVSDYSQRLNAEPSLVVPGEYALWRTATLNLSVRQDAKVDPGSLRHLGWEDPSAEEFTQDVDVNGIVWEQFNADLQAEEINELWPDADYQP